MLFLDLKLRFVIIGIMTDDKIKVLHIADNKEEGGRSSYTVDLIKALNPGLNENYLITSEASQIGKLAEIRRVNHKNSKKLTSNKVLKYAAEVGAQILHFHDNDSFYLIPSAKTSRRHSFRIVVDLHKYDWQKRRFPFQNKLKCGDMLIASTNREKNFAYDIPFPIDKVSVINKPVSALRFNQTISPRPILSAFNIPPEIMLLGTVARLDETMNYRLWADTIELIVKNYGDIEFLIVGEGKQRAAFESSLKGRGLYKKTLFTGFRDDIPQVLAAMDIYFHPTFEDMVPYSVLEAMAVGKPVVSPNLSSIREMFVNERNGLFYDVESPESAFKLISHFKENPSEQAEVVRNNVEDTANKFSIKHAANRVLDLYRKLLDQ
jgi:glycosyltransferase involved in cell wall biosynthesis